MREPLATCFSIYSSYFATSSLGFSADLAETARYYVRYHRLMDHWRRLYPGEILDFSYADLVADQERATRALLTYCGLDWHDGCVDFHRTERVVKTLSFNQVRKPLYVGADRRTTRFSHRLGAAVDILRDAGLI
jgi:hypothetical protein